MSASFHLPIFFPHLHDPTGRLFSRTSLHVFYGECCLDTTMVDLLWALFGCALDLSMIRSSLSAALVALVCLTSISVFTIYRSDFLRDFFLTGIFLGPPCPCFSDSGRQPAQVQMYPSLAQVVVQSWPSLCLFSSGGFSILVQQDPSSGHSTQSWFH